MMRRLTSAPKPAARVAAYMSSRPPSRRLAQPVAHAVIAGEVRRGLGRRDDVIGRQRILRVRQADLDRLGARVAQPFDALVPQRVDLRGHAVDAIFGGNSDALALEIARQTRFLFRHRQIERGRILGVEPAHHFEQDRAVAHRLGHRPGLVERARERDDPPARAAAIGRLDPANAGEGGRLADRAAGVGAGNARREPRRDRRRRSARRSAGGQRRIAAVVALPRARSPGHRRWSRSTSPSRTRPC